MSKFSNGFQVNLVFIVLLLNISVQELWATNSFPYPSQLATASRGGILETTSTTDKPPSANLCPDNEKISPCTCGGWMVDIICDGYLVVQETIDRLMTELRVVNGVTEDQILFTNKSLIIKYSSLTSLDLTSLFNSHFERIIVTGNNYLTQVHGPLSRSSSNSSFDGGLRRHVAANQYFGSINTRALFLNANRLTDAGLADCLHYFSPSLEGLHVANNQLEGPSTFNMTEFIEFLPGISNFVNLQDLDLYGNEIRFLKGAPFKVLGSLRSLSFTGVEKVGEDALLMDENGTNSASERTIVIENCLDMSDGNFSINSGLNLWKGKTTLDLTGNRFEFLAKEKFEPFLQINEENSMMMDGNWFVCDRRMKWLKDGRASYERRVEGVYCTNDPEPKATIFTTDLDLSKM